MSSNYSMFLEIRTLILGGLMLTGGQLATAQTLTDTEVGAPSPGSLAEEGTFVDQVDDVMTLWKGDGDNHLRLTALLEAGYFNQSDSWFGNDEANLGDDSGLWWEGAFHPGIEGSYALNQGELYGRVSAVYAVTSSDLDAAGSNPDGSESSMRMEDAYLGWRSGDLFDLGHDFLDISFGRQQYTAGTSFLIHNLSSNGGSRGAYWIGERVAADYAAVITMKTEQFQADLVYFSPDDNPDSDTELGGVTLDYFGQEWGSIGGGYYHLTSDIDSRDSMDVYDIRGQLKPFELIDAPEWLQPLTFDGEYVYEKNGSELEADGWYTSVTYAWADASFEPSLTYRYASFEGDDPSTSKSENFDPLFYGTNDWGQWFQGEILGEYVLSNSNLNSHSFILKASPTDTLTLNLIYYIFELDDEAGYGVSDDDLATEIDFIVDWAATENLSFSMVFAAADPGDGAEEAFGGDDDWLYCMFYGSLSF